MNNYMKVIPDRALRCTREDADAITAVLENGDEHIFHGFEFEYTSHGDHGEGALLARENGTWTELPRDALRLVGGLIAQNQLSYLEFGVSFSADRLVYDSCGGTAFRIYPNGELVERTERWVLDDVVLARALYETFHASKTVPWIELRQETQEQYAEKVRILAPLFDQRRG